MDVLKKLNQPYPFSDDKWYTDWIINGSFSVFVFLFLSFLEPFELYNVNTAYKLKVFAGYGGVTFTILSVNTLLSYLFKSMFDDTKWVVWKHIVYVVWLFFTIGLGNLLYTHYIFGFPELNFQGVIMFQLNTILVGIFPITILVLVKQNFLLKRHQQSAQWVNEHIESHPDVNQRLLKIYAENEKDYIELDKDDLLYIQAYGNYVKIHHINNGEPKTDIIRTSLSRVQKQLSSVKEIFKSHRTFMVNLDKVTSVNGNAQGYQLHLNGYSDIVPVSRSYIKSFNELMQ